LLHESSPSFLASPGIGFDIFAVTKPLVAVPLERPESCMSRLSFAASAAILAALPLMASAEKASASTGVAIASANEGTPLLQQVGYGVWREGWHEWHGGWHPGCCWEPGPPPPPRVEYYPAPTYYESGAYYAPRVYERQTYERRTYESTGSAPYGEEALPPLK
jgi:hypothetical protein